MKNLIKIFAALTLTINAAYAGINPAVILKSETVEVTSVEELDFFTHATFNSSSDNLEFTTTKEMSVVQIYGANGNMEFQLPVMSNNIQINKNLFGQGSYKLGFVLSGETKVHFTEVTVK